MIAQAAVSVTEEDLDRARRQHLRELRLLARMTDAQYSAFRRNFSLGVVDPSLDRKQVMDLLRTTLITNVTLQRRGRGPESAQASEPRS